jgi:ornithine carbamoyltransferase
MTKLTGRSLLALGDLTNEEMVSLIDLADELKEKKRSGVRGELLDRKNIAIITEKASTRTRCAFAVAAADEGAHAEFLGRNDIHLGEKESVADTAQVLGRMFHGIMFRGYTQETVQVLAENAGVPVWNGLTDKRHPSQALADLQTAREQLGELAGLRVVYVGDGRNNVANSLMLACAKTGVHFTDCTPEPLSPDEDLVREAREAAAGTGGSVTVEADPSRAVQGANVVYTDVWVSMGEEKEFQERIKVLHPYQVTMDLMKKTGNLDDGRAIFLHCLPAFHDHNTKISKEIGALEVTDDVFRAPFSKVLDLAENRLHAAKAMMVATMTER